MRLDEAEKILNDNGYELLEENFDVDILTYLGGIWGAWAGLKTIQDIFRSSGDVKILKFIIKEIEKNKEEYVQLLYYSLLPGTEKEPDVIKKQHPEINWTISDADLGSLNGIDNTLQTKLNLKLHKLSYDELLYVIKQSLIVDNNNKSRHYYFVDNLWANGSKIRQYKNYIIELYTDILWEALHPDNEISSIKLNTNLKKLKELTSMKSKFKNMWNNLYKLWKQSK